MQLFLDALDREVDELHKNKVRLRFIGDRHALSVKLQARMAASEELTAANTGPDAAGRRELRRPLGHRAGRAATRGRRSRAARCRSRTSTRTRFARELQLGDMPEPDLFIRTGGEQRISNFLLWKLAYTELYFCDTLWPDFDVAAVRAALAAFARPRAALRPDRVRRRSEAARRA